MKKSQFIIIILILVVLVTLFPVVNADQTDSDDEPVSDTIPVLEELPELDMTGMYTDIELIEIDPEIMNATDDWMILAHDDDGKRFLMDDIDNSDLTAAGKIDTKEAVRKLWETYPTKFEDAGEKTIEIVVHSDGSDHTVSVPIGHVTRITFDKEKIRKVSKENNDIRLMKAVQEGDESSITLSDSEKLVIKNITDLRVKKNKEATDESYNPSSDRSQRASSSPGNSFSSGFSSSSISSGSVAGTGLKAWSADYASWYGSPYNLPPEDPALYADHNSYAYYGAYRMGLNREWRDVAAFAAIEPDTWEPIIDPSGGVIKDVMHCWNHYYNPQVPEGGAPGEFAKYAGYARDQGEICLNSQCTDIQFEYLATRFGWASHFLTDVGNPMHTGQPVTQAYDKVVAKWDTHAKYELDFVNANWKTTNGAGYGNFGNIVSAGDVYFYKMTNPEQSIKNLATFSNTYVNTLYYRVRNNPDGFKSDPVVNRITENCIRASARYTNGFAYYVMDNNPVIGPPEADFKYNIREEDGSSANIDFISTSRGAISYHWTFPDGSSSTASTVTKLLSPQGMKTVTLTVKNSQNEEDSKSMDIPVACRPAIASFTAVRQEYPNVKFIAKTNTGINSESNPTSWYWDFGDLSNSGGDITTSEITHTYLIPETYIVTLTAKNVYGNGITYDTVSIPPTAVAEFTFTQAKKVVSFKAKSDSASAWLWKFGDGGTSTDRNPTHEYVKPGTYDVELTVQDLYWTGEDDTQTQKVDVSDSTFYADFTAIPTSGSSDPLLIQFTDDSSTSSPPTSWLWTFGDGSTSILQNPSHQYLTNGTFTVSLTATNSTSGSSTKTKTNYITVGPLYAETSGNYTILKFNTTGSTKWTPPPGVTQVDYLVVAGGGEGGRGGSLSGEYYPGAGGGAGGVKNGSSYAVTGPQTIVVGAGGSGPAGGSYSQGYPGGNSVFNTITSTGGGGGGGGTGGVYTGGNGGSGGGGNAITNTAGTGNPGEGNNGGIGNYTMLGNPAGGGGGAAAPGVSPGLSPYGINQGNGGNGRSIDITGTSVHYGGGGGGGYGNPATSPGIGGLGCGADGSMGDPLPVKCQGTGAGGGGSGNDKHGAGGSGVVIIRYLNPVVVAPIANFTASPMSGTAPLTVTFTDISTNTPTGWLWDFDNNGVVDSSSQNPSYTYTANGTYTVKLTAANSAGSNTTTKTGYISANTGSVQPTVPYPKIEANKTYGDLPLTVAFNGSSSGGAPDDWMWNFGDGQISTLQNPVHTYTVKGNYTVNLTVNNSAGTNTESLSNWIRPGYYVISIDESDNNSTIYLNKTDFIRLKLSQCRGCGFELTMNASPGLTIISYNFLIDHPEWDGGPGYHYWDIMVTDDGNQNITAISYRPWDPYNGNSTFRLNVSVVSTQAVNSTGTISYFTFEGGGHAIIADNNEVYDITPCSGNYCVDGLRVAFTGIPHPEMSTIRMFGVPFTVSSITPLPPEANFTSSSLNGTTPLTIVFNDTSSSAPTAWYWEFGDGATANTRNVTWVYSIPGTYSIKHSATNTAGTGWINQTDSIIVIEGYIPPTPPASISNLHNGTVTNNSISWAWANPIDPDYAEVIAYKNNVLFTSYPNTTTSTVWSNLTATTQYTISTHTQDSSGNINLTWVNATVTTEANPSPPVVDFNGSPISGTAPLTVIFTDSSITTPTSWNWNFGDGNITNATVQNPVHSFLSAGNYTVNLTVTNSAGSNTTIKSNYITVMAPVIIPVTNFTGIPVSGTAPLTVSFSDSSTNTPTSWSWNFGDGNTANSTVKNPVHTFLSAGSYRVNLTATNSAGSNTISKSNYITVTAPVLVPVANFTGTPTAGNSPMTVQFTDISTNNPTSWNWNFGDGSTVNASQRNPIYTYTYSAHEHGPFTVNLTATNSAGSNTISKPSYISLFPPPEIRFTATPQSGRSPLTVIFTDTSPGTLTSWSWNFGDGNTTNSTLKNPVHTYLANGMYNVSLTVTNSNGTSATKTMMNYITVNPNSPYTLIDGNYTVVIFNSTGPMTWTPPSGITQINYLVVAGGGAGGSKFFGGGGGAGGLISSSTTVSAGTPYTMTVGSGGQISTLPRGGQGLPGGASSIRGGSINITANGGGGGGGGTTTNTGGNGGSGGGGYCMGVAATGGNGITGQGNNGGGASSNPAGGGGGGAGAGGQPALSIFGGAGGTGIVSSIIGSSVYYAGGGGGSAVGSGGNGGGGSANKVGTASTGGGGGAGAAGGSGVVIIRYLTPI